jgi:signal peptidase I
MPVEPTADSASPPSKKPPAATPHPDGNVKDTIESILVAFILAFIFRAFVVEAFVIPTGSMAPTLLGAHMQFHCTDCGYAFTVNYSSGKPDYIPAHVGKNVPNPIICPNCGFSIRETAAPDEDSLANPAVHYGDRILVLKYRYLLSGPERWDVIVFKSPDHPPERSLPYYTTNYIKRLIGKPGESVMILDGDIYVSTSAPPNSDAGFEQFLRTFQVQRKPAHAQAALWRNVYDNDYLPHLSTDQRMPAKTWVQPWQIDSGAGWDLGQNLPEASRGRTRVFRFDNPQGSGVIHFARGANEQTSAFTDFLAYDQYSLREKNGRLEQTSDELERTVKNTVTDLKLSCFYKRESGDGPFRMSLTKLDQKFVVELTPGQASLKRYELSTGKLLKDYGAVPLPSTSSALRLDLANVDYRASLRINDNEVLASGDDYGPSPDDIVKIEASQRAKVAVTAPEAKIEAAQQKATLEHIALARDIHYINGYDYARGGRSQNLLGSPDRIVTLKSDEYFALGDNSLISGDGRMWSNNVVLPGEDLPFVEHGRVPARFLLGKAFFVYWPAGHRPFGWDLGIIPNFGEMRFIR